LWEAFLVQMNDFDKILELKLRHLLDPVVASRPPARRARPRRPLQPILTVVEGVRIELAAEAIAVVEPVVVTLPVAAARQL
jgi:hypothetical protein